MNKYIKNIKTIIKNIFPKELPKPMGRWRIEDNYKQMNNKIDLSNEDHCGPCGQYALSKIEVKTKDITEKQQTENQKKI